jgi:hypothetical protein
MLYFEILKLTSVQLQQVKTGNVPMLSGSRCVVSRISEGLLHPSFHHGSIDKSHSLLKVWSNNPHFTFSCTSDPSPTAKKKKEEKEEEKKKKKHLSIHHTNTRCKNF